jgi:hypothetical protein
MLKRIPQAALQQADAALQPLMQSVRAALFASPIDPATIKASLIALFEYLCSPAGRTEDNCRAVDSFFYLDDDLPPGARTRFLAGCFRAHGRVT